MLTDDLFQKILIAPAKKRGVDRLQIVSGFATANMADRQMEKLAKIDKLISIELIVGMTRQMGIEKARHYALKKLAEQRPYDMDFSCRYVVLGTPVHAKSYCWLEGDSPQAAFAGSANYTMTAFGRSQIECMTKVDADQAAQFYSRIFRDTENCLADDIDNKVTMLETKRPAVGETTGEEDSVTLSLLTRGGETPRRSGINWGQRAKRDKDQAYISIPSDKYDFFPKRGEQFTVLTDNDESFIMVRVQDDGKALHTTQNNALLGRYLRQRMNLPSETYVTRQHLVEYGRTSVTFTKIDDETYYLDFLPNMGPGEDSEAEQE